VKIARSVIPTLLNTNSVELIQYQVAAPGRFPAKVSDNHPQYNRGGDTGLSLKFHYGFIMVKSWRWTYSIYSLLKYQQLYIIEQLESCNLLTCLNNSEDSSCGKQEET
jgi:hypothetical protein